MKDRTSNFVRLFSGIALFFSALAALGSSLQLLLVLSIPAESLEATVTDQGPLPTLIMNHILGFTVFCWFFAVVAVGSSLGLRRGRCWSYVAWVLLLGVLLAWSLLTVASETYHVVTSSDSLSSPGLMPSDRVLSAVLVIPLGLVVATLSAFLLRRFLDRSMRDRFLPQDK